MSAAVEVGLVPARFAEVRVGDWFRETPDGAWHLKSRGNSGVYVANGVTGQPRFEDGETVLVPPSGARSEGAAS